MVLGEKIFGNAIGAFVQYGVTAAKAALKPLLVTDNWDGTGTLHVATDSSVLPTGAATSAKQDTGNASLASIKTAVEGSTPAGTNIIGKVGIDQATANANEVVVKSITAGPLPDTAASDLAHIHTGIDAIKAQLPASLGKKTSATSLSVVEAPATRSIVGHDKTMTGSAVALSAVSAIYQKVYLLAVGAAGTTYVGDSAVVAGHGIPLNTTTAFCIDGPIDLANVYCIGTSPDEVAIVGLYEA